MTFLGLSVLARSLYFASKPVRGFTAQTTWLPLFNWSKQKRQDIHFRIWSPLASIALLAKSGSDKRGRPMETKSVISSFNSSLAISASRILETAIMGTDTSSFTAFIKPLRQFWGKDMGSIAKFMLS